MAELRRTIQASLGMGISGEPTTQKRSFGASSLKSTPGESHYEIGSIRDAERAFSGTETLGPVAASQLEC